MNDEITAPASAKVVTAIEQCNLPRACSPVRRIVIVGAGVAGLSAAIWLRRFGLDPLLIEQNRRVGGILRRLGHLIPDYPGIAQISGERLANRLARHAQAVAAEVRCTVRVEGICPERHLLKTSDGNIHYAGLIIATGSRDRGLEVPGELSMRARGETPIAEIDASKYRGLRVVVVGGGDRAFEESLILADANVFVTLVHRSDRFRAQQRFVDRALMHPNVRIERNTRVAAIHGMDRVEGVDLINADGQIRLDCVAVFVRVGTVGNIDFCRSSFSCDSDDFIRVDTDYRTTTSGIWAIGDCIAPATIRSITTAAGQAALVAKQFSLGTLAPLPPVLDGTRM